MMLSIVEINSKLSFKKYPLITNKESIIAISVSTFVYCKILSWNGEYVIKNNPDYIKLTHTEQMMLTVNWVWG